MKFLLVLFIAVAFVATGEALECYKCLWPQSGCDDPFDKSANGVTKRTCPGADDFCFIAVSKLSNGTSHAERGCMLGMSFTQRASNRATVYLAEQTIKFCNSTLCNGVSTTSAALSMLMVLALPFVFRNHH